MDGTAWLLVAWLSVAGGFAESFTCTITGYAYGMPGEAPDFIRSDGCQMIRSRVEQDGSLVLWSKWYWVRIKLPAAGGMQAFWYRWGSDRAHLRADDWPVAWGRVSRG